MNPKLRDLQIQAFAECKTFEDGQFRTDEAFERFAELIVRECLRVVDSNIYGPYGEYDYSYTNEKYEADNRAKTIYDEIQAHFGVSE